ncbi:restriction endonuclease subunit S [Halochromatium roseum]|uniref:restriction endonuclease subunit S n=1 Tax=Halochromatium roseum TaxID=391920 RepID=UPI00191250DA|nr:restriction endonuclease subunit S [Halochromatium roseum]
MEDGSSLAILGASQALTEAAALGSAHGVDCPITDICSVNPESLGSGSEQPAQFRYLDISSINQGVIDWSVTRVCSRVDAPSRAQRVVRPGDVLLSTVRPGLKAHGIIRTPVDLPLVASTGFAVLRPHQESDSAYLFHQLFGNAVASQLRAREVGSNYPAVNEQDVEALRLYAPPAIQREHIGAFLDHMDEAIQQSNAVIVKLKQIRIGLLHDLLTRGIDENGDVRDPGTKPEHFDHTPLGRLPKQWTVLLVEEAGQVRLGRQRSPAHEAGSHIRPYLRVANVFDGYIDYTDVLSMNFDPAEQKIYGLEPDDILLNEGQSLELVGRSAVYRGDPGAFCFQNTLIRFRCNSRSVPDYCQAVFHHWLHTGRFTRVAKQTTSVAHLGADRFAKMPFPLPPIQEQERIVQGIRACDDTIRAEEDGAKKLRNLRAGLSKDLLSGRVTLPLDMTMP